MNPNRIIQTSTAGDWSCAAVLERQVAMLSRKVLGATTTAKANGNAKPTRFSAKGLRVQRSRFGLGANDFGKLIGVSAQSIYNWEAEKGRPRAEQIASWVALRSLGKREAAARLEQMGGAKG
jgi:DNA-binding XRE family transcriptional regulator